MGTHGKRPRTRLLRLAMNGTIGALLIVAGSEAGVVRATATTPKWSVTSSPNRYATPDNSLRGVSCASTHACTAVGKYFNPRTDSFQTLIESRSGSAWAIVPSPNGGTSTNELHGVSCASPSSCTAVGYFLDVNFNRATLIESWSGTAWAIVPSPAPAGWSTLDSVSCVSASSCIAVGSVQNSAVQTLVESWNGSGWSIVPSPNNGTGGSALGAVSCVSSTSCTAVGWSWAGGGPYQTLVES